MPPIYIESPRDPRVGVYMNLRERDLAARYGRFIAEGELVVERLLASRFEVESVLVAPSHLDKVAVPAHVPLYCAPRAVLAGIAGFNFHRGVLACGMRPPPDDAAPLPAGGQEALAVAISGVRDPMNLGGILRNCAAFGVDFVLLGNQTVDPFSRRALRVSMAAALQIPLRLSTNLDADLRRLQDDQGFVCLATVLDSSAASLAELRRPPRLMIVLGNEYDGVADATQQLCHLRVTLPMAAPVDSLNVAVAAGIFLYHFRQVAQPAGEA
jgi:tRNA G18 (ribose-2'-O)-methylase SpoU